MHFYHWTWDQIMGTPLKLFWTLMKQAHRIRAAENLRWFSIMSMAQSGGEEDRRNFITDQQKNMGITVVVDERDDEGINKLRNM